MHFVIDASVAIKWFIAEAESKAALKLRAIHYDCHAPQSLIAEVANAAWKKALRGEIDASQATRIVRHLPSYVQNLHEVTALNERALEIALELRQPVHDCLYLACAEAIEGPMLTADRRLLEAIRNTPFAARVHHLAALPEPLLSA